MRECHKDNQEHIGKRLIIGASIKGPSNSSKNLKKAAEISLNVPVTRQARKDTKQKILSQGRH